jgi:hypothetical protein
MLRQSRSTNTLSRHAPLPSMLIAMPLSASTPVKACPVNCGLPPARAALLD